MTELPEGSLAALAAAIDADPETRAQVYGDTAQPASRLPYTDDDLRAEAASQHKTATEDPDFMGIGEQMQGGDVWDALGDDDFEAAQRKVDGLLNGAADVSDWAIQLGADGMEPEDRTLWMGPAGKPAVRVMFAFAEDMSDADRDDFISEIAAHMVTAN